MAQGAQETDEGLIRRIEAGDQAAMRVLYARHAKRVFHYLMRFTRDSAAAEDLTNDVFIDVWKGGNRFEGRSQASTWLLAIARYKALSARRRQRETVDSETVLENWEAPGDTPEVTAQKADKGRRLRECIEQLSQEHREVINLVYYQEKSVKEISEITGAAEATVKTRMFYARKNLSALMAQAGLDRGWP
ncbi:sigma-70 family RNA polymerase sigma factor [Nitratireductor mangrovi]|uniref:Sigma-70 family RNA polymerase sigma factor n=2 Tax=Nitratireductor mangrovi TaxID=2599600 RepID=A0A5B8KWS1_9HYPH|nr:sigma-70 family RNA polymerase sigma factor [Nitratireductor mangrovi]